MISRFVLLLLLLCALVYRLRAEEETCSLSGEVRNLGLKEMIYNIGDGPQTFLAYVEPDIASFYQGKPPASTKVVPKFDGFAGKFINMSKQPVMLYWEREPGSPVSPMRRFPPFSSYGTATFPTHRFFFTPEGGDPKTDRLIEFVMGTYPENLYVYNPYLVVGDEEATSANLKNELNENERNLYDLWHKTLLFNEQYLNFTGRTYLAGYLREASKHFFWPADYFGQEHWVTTRETHFEKLPPATESGPVTVQFESRILKDDDPRSLQEYRVQDTTVMNMTLRVLSCAPRVLEIKNFLSPAEVQHILELAGGIELHESKTGGANDHLYGTSGTKQHKTRTSFNSWVSREESPIIDAIFRRSADLIRIPEALLRSRGETEHPEWHNRRNIAEPLQLVHYGPTQEYTSHHDFGYTAIDDKLQGARFLTLLFYLNDSMEGGETTFPRWVNAETFRKLEVKPEVGKAVLF
jgi:prolyl 4-hydroxylase